MFAKVFEQIFDSSIAEDYLVRLVFEDFLVLADPFGIVDMTHEAIARRTNVPLEIVRSSIQKLSQPDPRSRSPKEDGRRLILLDSHRDWGWQIVNYEDYRKLRDEENRREYMRQYMRNKRKPDDKPVNSVKHPLAPVNSVSGLLAKEEVEEEGEGKSFTPEMVAGGVLDEIGPLHPLGFAAVIDICRAMLAKDIAPEHIKSQLVGAWTTYKQAIPNLEWNYSSPQKFFEGGLWADPKLWPWKDGHQPKPTERRETALERRRREIAEG